MMTGLCKGLLQISLLLVRFAEVGNSEDSFVQGSFVAFSPNLVWLVGVICKDLLYDRVLLFGNCNGKAV